MAKLLIFGCGYTGTYIANTWNGDVIGTTRSRHDDLRAKNITPLTLDHINDLENHIKTADAIIISTPAPDPVVEVFGETIAASNAWVGYLSTTAIYGDRNGGEVDETTTPAPTSKRGELRLQTELDWQAICPRVNIFRLAGIYGIGRGPIVKLRSNNARKIIKEGQVFGRIHVEDIARIVLASYERSDQGEVYNLTDDLTAPPQDVLDYAADLLCIDRLPKTPFETAKMSPMARGFYSENKRVINTKIKNRFGEMLYPDYKIGLQAIMASERALRR